MKIVKIHLFLYAHLKDIFMEFFIPFFNLLMQMVVGDLMYYYFYRSFFGHQYGELLCYVAPSGVDLSKCEPTLYADGKVNYYTCKDTPRKVWYKLKKNCDETEKDD